MNTTLLYVLFALPGSGWHGSHEVYSTAEPNRCERIASQLNNTGTRYECQTLVTTKK